MSGDAVDPSVWGAVILSVLSCSMIIYVLCKAPGKPLAREVVSEVELGVRRAREQQRAMAYPAAASASASLANVSPAAAISGSLRSSADPAALVDSGGVAELSAEEEDELDVATAVIRDQKLQKQRRTFLLCTIAQGALFLLFFICVLVDSWERLSLATYAPVDLLKPETKPITVSMRFGLGGRKVGPIEPAGVQLNASTFESGSYSRLCVQSSSILGCSLGAQIGVGVVVIHSMLALACSAGVLAYFVLAPRCTVPATPDARNLFLGVVWRAALICAICIVAVPLLWLSSFHASLQRIVLSETSRSTVLVGPSWVLALICALLVTPATYAARRALQLLHSEDDSWCKAGAARRSQREGGLMGNRGADHHYRAPGMQSDESHPIPQRRESHEDEERKQEQTIPASARFSLGDPEIAEPSLSHEQSLLRPHRFSPPALKLSIASDDASAAEEMKSRSSSQRQSLLDDEAGDLEEL